MPARPLRPTRRATAALALAAAPLCLLTAAAPTRAQTTFYFAQPGTTTPIAGNTLTASPGQVLNLSVVYQSTFAANGVEVFVGYDRTNTEGPNAARLDNLFALNGDASSAVSNVNSLFTSFGGQEGGGQGAGTRPYGDDVALVTATPGTTYTATAPTQVFDISLKDLNFSSGTYGLTIYSVAPPAGQPDYTEFDTFLTNGSATSYASTYTLNVVGAPAAAPEPASWAGMGAGLLGLAALGLRARRRKLMTA